MQPKWRHKMQPIASKTKNKDHRISINEALKITKPAPIMYCSQMSNQPREKKTESNYTFFPDYLCCCCCRARKINSHYSSIAFLQSLHLSLSRQVLFIFPWWFCCCKAINFSIYILFRLRVLQFLFRQHVRQIDRN